jgi:hypothetical protein
MTYIIHLVYISKAIRPMNSDDFPSLLTPARENNHHLQINGMLLYQRQAFLQVMEGRKTVVENLLRSIVKDERHTDVTVLLKRPIAAREYADWDLKFINLDTINLSKIKGYNAYARAAIDPKHFEMGNFSHTFLAVFRDLKI